MNPRFARSFPYILLFLLTLQTNFFNFAYSDPADVETDDNSETSSKSTPSQSWGMEKIFNDPAWASGMASGAKSLNRSIDLLMESIFYKLLDNELIYSVNDTTQFTAGLKRDLFFAQDGQYIVVDRFSIGPRYLKEIMKMQQIPIRLGGDVNTNVFSIYVRSDAMRLNDDLDKPFFRVIANNWLGVLPFLSAILPPSFNANELYDPIRQMTTPFQLPLTPESVNKMEIGSIRSYSLTGGVYLGLDVLERYQNEIKDALGKDFKFATNLPYSVFRTGEHRINVMRKSEHVVWVGLSESGQIGHGIDAQFGKLYLIFSKVVNIWKGVNAPIFPLNFKNLHEHIDKIEMIYSFNLDIPQARIAYEQAVSGNFTYAASLQEAWIKNKHDYGVRFEYKANTATNRSENETDNSFFVQRVRKQKSNSKSEIEVTDLSGKFSILEAKSTDTHDNWNVLVGQESLSYENRYQVLVKKSKTGKKTAEFQVDDSAKDPYSLTLSFRVSDRYCDAEELSNYLAQARNFSMLLMKEVPSIPIRDQESLTKYRKTYAIDDPTNDITHIKITPTYLGEFRLDSSIYFSSQALSKIEKTQEKRILSSFLSAYDIQWFKPSEEQVLVPLFLRAFDWIALLATYPFRMLNFDVSTVDSFLEINNGISAFRQIKKATSPLQKVNGYRMLLDTNHPEKLAIALLGMSRLEEIPRSVSLGALNKGMKQSSSYKLFGSLNRKNFFSERRAPDTSRYRNLQDKFDQLLPNLIQNERNSTPVKVRISVNEPDQLPQNGPLQESIISVNICSRKFTGSEAKIYVRLEQSGKVNLGRFVLIEKVLILRAENKVVNMGASCFNFALTGRNSPFSGLILDNILSLGGDFDLIIAISEDGLNWSDKKNTPFRIKDGKVISEKD